MSKTRKSKKGHQPTHAKARKPSPEGAAAGESGPSPEKGTAKGDDEFVYVPRGKSRGTYLFILGLMVFTLIIFVVPGQFTALFDPRASGGPEAAFMTWEHPRLGAQNVSSAEFASERRRLNSFYYFFGVRDERLTGYEATAAFLVTDALARDAGVEVSNQDVGRAILEGESGRLQGFQSIGGKQAYVQRLQQLGMAAPALEATLRDVLRVWRFQSLLAAVAGAWEPAALEESWRGRHEEYTFDLLEAVTADFVGAATAELPDEAELRAWYEALPPRSGAFASDWIGERVSAEVAGFAVDGDWIGERVSGEVEGFEVEVAVEADPSALLERYPVPEGTDAAAAARDYYDRTFHVRFRREEPIEGEEDPRSRIYLSFEEVEEVALREAPVHAAMGLWLGDLRTRLAAGETLDLAQEAADLKLDFQPVGEAMDLTAWREAEGWGGSYLGSGLFRAGPEGLVPDVVVDERGISIARVVERLEAGAAPYEDLAEKVAEEWAVERSSELALESLKGAYDALVGDRTLAEGEKAEVDAEAFANQAAALGLTVQTRDWFDRSEQDPPGYEPTPLELYTRQATWRLGLEQNQIAEPALDDAKERAWFVRCGGVREPPELKITPSELNDLHREASFTGFLGAAGLTSYESYEELYSLRLDLEPSGDEELDEGEGESGEG